MDIVNNLFDFIEKYSQENPMKLRLKRFENLNFNLSFAIDQIESRQKIKSKLPLWNQNKKLLFPSVLSAEQASSEITAKYKQCIIGSKYKSICDLTGGLGIDSYYFAASAEKVTYIERYPLYCDVAKYNFDVLQKNNIRVICSDSLKFILECNVKFDAFYIDPARRNSENKRLYDLRDCEPDIIELQSILLKKAPVILLKSSPMIDISRAIQDLKFVKEVHVISVKNECKELFFIINNHFSEDEISINCVNLSPVQQPENYIFTLENEKNLPLLQSVTSIQSYLYEPNSSILKAGAFKSVAISFSISKIHKNSHLYTSNKLITDFLGRIFTVKEVIPFSGKVLKKLSMQYPSANITVRNFPITTEELRKKSKIKDGGNIYIFATTLYPDKKIFIICEKIINA